MATALATSDSKKHSRQWLREYVVTPTPCKVDREAGIIRDVKILGWESDNKRRYLPEAGKAAVSRGLYENAKVFFNHPKQATDPRDTNDAFGKLRNVRWAPEGIFGDLHFLKSHSMAARVCDDAESGLGVFGLSHNARGDGRVADGVFVVEEIMSVRSVDVVTEAATTTNLFEGKEPIAKKLSELVEGMKAKKELKAALTEAMKGLKLTEDGELGDMAPTADDDVDWKQHLVDAIGKLVSSDDADNHEMAKKILGMLKPAEAAATEDDETPPEKPKEDDKEKAKAEGKQQPATQAGAVLTEAQCKSLCKLAGIDADKPLLEALVGMAKTTEDAIRLIELAKGQPSLKKNAPKSSPAGTGKQSFTEHENAAKPDDVSSFVARIKR